MPPPPSSPPFFFPEGKIKDKGCWQFRATKTDVPIPKLITKSLQILLLHIQVSKKLTGSSIFFEAIYIHNCITGSVLTTTERIHTYSPVSTVNKTSQFALACTVEANLNSY